MQLKEINHNLYRKRLKIVFTGIVLTLTFFSLSLSTLFIAQFSTPDENHFYHNLAGLFAAVFIVIYILTKIRHHPYLHEVVYVWDLKQQLNRISRKEKKLKEAVEKNNITAMTIMLFFYQGSKQLYELDENTLTMDSLISDLIAHEARMKKANLSTRDYSYYPALLDQF